MASTGIKYKKLPLIKKACLLGVISFFAFALIFGVKSVFAYYYDTASLSILANKIGDFDSADGDINMLIYKETEENSNVFVRSNYVPYVGYKLNTSLTSCTKPCDDSGGLCSVTCGTDESSSCYYKYDDSTNTFTLTSNHKVTCKFYFEEESTSDINIYVMKEDVAGTYTYSVNSKTYSIIESIPAYGYKYIGYECENAVEALNYDSITKKFSVSTKTKNTCYAYFDQAGSADIIANVYVQSDVGSTIYNYVETIPSNNIYVLSTNKNSYCYDSTGTDTGATITYTDGYIDITANGKQTCDVYLDLATE